MALLDSALCDLCYLLFKTLSDFFPQRRKVAEIWDDSEKNSASQRLCGIFGVSSHYYHKAIVYTICRPGPDGTFRLSPL
jgi:hypothetical protein